MRYLLLPQLDERIPSERERNRKELKFAFTQSRQKCEGGEKILEFVSIKGCST